MNPSKTRIGALSLLSLLAWEGRPWGSTTQGRTRPGSRRFRPDLPDLLEQRALLSAISDSAYPLLINRAEANRNDFFAYQDADSGFNRGFPSGFFADSPATLAKIHINSAAVDDPSAADGVSTDPNALDRVHGNVLKLSIDPLTAGQFAGVNFEEPENWGVRRIAPNVSFQGYDLRGSTTLVLEVRSPTPGGIMVQFGVGGGSAQPYAKVTDYMHVAQSPTYQTLRIPLASLKDPFTHATSPPDLSDVHILFSVATNDIHAPGGGTLLIDNVRFEPVPTSQGTRLAFPLSNQTFGVLPQGQPPIPLDQVIRNLTTTYETSLVIFNLLNRGTPGDLANARAILDALVYAQNHDNAGDPIPTATVDGAEGRGLHDGYSSGDLALLNDQDASQNQLGQQGQVRLAGFSVDSDLAGPSHFALVLDGAFGGNNAFAIMALLRGYQQFGDLRYLDAARSIGRWIVGNLMDTSGTGYGGYYVGYSDQGAPKHLLTGKSIENNADIAASFILLAKVERQLGDSAEADRWEQRAYVAGDFVLRMFDPAAGRFYAGTVPAGTPAGPGIDPSGPQQGNDVINTYDFLDAQTFTTLALASIPRYRDQIDWRCPVQHVLDTFAKTVTATTGGLARTYQGFSLVAVPTATPERPNPADGIAWEFTGQVVVAMRFVDQLYGQTTYEALADHYLAQIRQAQQLAPFGDGQGLAAATLQGESEQGGFVPVNQALSTPFQAIPERVGLAATTWAILADQNVNLFAQTQSTAPAAVSLSAVSDTGASNADRLTRLNNSSPQDRLQFIVTGTVPGAAVTLFADGIAIGTAAATGPSTIVTTGGTLRLFDGLHVITALQTEPGQLASTSSASLTIAIDATPPIVAAVIGVSPPSRATPVATIDFALSEPIDPSAFPLSGLSLTRDSAAIPLTLGVALDPLSPTAFRLQGLGPTTFTTGTYVFTVQANAVRDLAGNVGTGSQSIAWYESLTAQSIQPMLDRRGFVTAIALTFNGPLDVARAQRVANYRLVQPGRDGRFGTRDDRGIPLRSARLQAQPLPAANGILTTVTLTPRSRIAFRQPLLLRVSGSPPRGLADPSGRLLDGNVDGLPGGDFATIRTRQSAASSTVSGLSLSAPAVDVVLESGIFPSRRTRRLLLR